MKEKEKVFITGVHGGIGKYIMRSLIGKGHEVIGSDLGLEADESIDGHGPSAYYSLDLGELESIVPTFNKIIKDHPDITMAVNNAGIAHLTSFLQEDEKDFQKVMDINFNSLVISTRFWLDFFESRGGGHIANMASMAGHIPPSGMCSYSASKHAVVGFSRSLQLELETVGSPVTISLISPGFVKTDIMKMGKENGFPKEFEYMTTSPEVAGERIATGILKREAFIIPDQSGKVMNQLNRWAPNILSRANRLIAEKMLKKG